MQKRVKGSNYKAIATRSSIWDIAGIPDPPPITKFVKLIFYLMQKIVVSLNLIAICWRSYLIGNYEITFY